MKAPVAAAAIVLLLALAGCTDLTDPAGDEPAPGAVTPSDVPVVDSPACKEVRAGIDAFNLGDFETTVQHFEAAVPLAEAQDDGSGAAGDLVDAVHYYAELGPGQYAEASRSSREFATYKAITLGQCSPVGDESDDPGTNV